MQKSKVFKNPIILINSLLIAVFLTMNVFSGSESIAFNNESPQPLNDGWFLQNANVLTPLPPLPQNIKTENHQPLVITRNLPKELPEPAVLCFRSSQQKIQVFMEDALIYSYGYEANLTVFGKSPGSIWNLVRLPSNSNEKRITIQLESPYAGYEGVINGIRVGSKASLLFDIFQQYLPDLILTLIVLITGITLLAAYAVFHNVNRLGSNVLHLGMFALLISIWMLGENKMTQFITYNIPFVTAATVLALLLAPIYILRLICTIQEFHFTKSIEMIIVSLQLNVTAVILLQMTNVIDIIEILPYSNIFLLFCILASCGIIWAELFIYHNNNIRPAALSLLVLLAFSLLEIIAFYSHVPTESGRYMRLGVVVFILLQAILAIRKVLKVIKRSHQAEHYEVLSTTDALTQCQNRRAFDQKLVKAATSQDMVILMADINSLKTINDSFGHAIGDEAIRLCAQCFCTTFQPYGDCFRLSGDEFAFIGVQISVASIQRLLQEFHQTCRQKSTLVSYPFSVSVGYAAYDAAQDTSIFDTIRRADHEMYKHKKEQRIQSI